jgi:hypothetical protein
MTIQFLGGVHEIHRSGLWIEKQQKTYTIIDNHHSNRFAQGVRLMLEERTMLMDEKELMSVIFEDMLLRLHQPFRQEFLDLLMHRIPGENTLTVLLDSWLGELPLLFLKKDCWHRQYQVNEAVNDCYKIASAVFLNSWGKDRDVSISNRPTRDFLASISDGSAMVMIATESLWAMTDTQLLECMKEFKRCLDKNGAAFIALFVRPNMPDFEDFYLDRLKLLLPKYQSLVSVLDRFCSKAPTEEFLCLLFAEAGLNSECICKQYPFQGWLLTRPEKKELFSRFY